MVDTREAIENVKGLARTFQSVIDLANALGDVADIDQAISEAQVRLVKAQKAAERGEVEAARIIEEAYARRDSAERIASTQMTDATRLCEEMTARTQQECDEMLNGAQRTLAAVEKSVAAYRENEAALERMITERTRELDDIEAKITRAKAKMAEMLGG